MRLSREVRIRLVYCQLITLISSSSYASGTSTFQLSHSLQKQESFALMNGLWKCIQFGKVSIALKDMDVMRRISPACKQACWATRIEKIEEDGELSLRHSNRSNKIFVKIATCYDKFHRAILRLSSFSYKKNNRTRPRLAAVIALAASASPLLLFDTPIVTDLIDNSSAEEQNKQTSVNILAGSTVAEHDVLLAMRREGVRYEMPCRR